MKEGIYDHTRIVEIPARKIKRHPECQRKSPLQAWLRKNGKFDPQKALELVHVVSDGNGGFYAIDKATTVEAANKEPHHRRHKFLCRVYGNGHPPSNPQLDELFTVLNVDRIAVRASTQFERAVGAGRPTAVFAKTQIDRLGPKFHTVTGLWALVKRYGDRSVERAVDEVIAIWGTKHHVPGIVLRAIVTILSKPNGAQALKARRSRLRREAPKSWLLHAQNDMYRTVGKRDSLSNYLVKRMLGRAI